MVGTEEVVDQFNATHKDIKVEYIEIVAAGTDGYSKSTARSRPAAQLRRSRHGVRDAPSSPARKPRGPD
ncbi:hypothetical protein LV779_12675 [Streptomyces thinghirensis]|nr:hypothetical protein [Streptomyces thinghirensis]